MPSTYSDKSELILFRGAVKQQKNENAVGQLCKNRTS